jgi:hypothetical protein
MHVSLEVHDAVPAIQSLAESKTVKHAALQELHRLHHEAQLHHFKETDYDAHLANWKVLKYAVEEVPHGTNYFMKVHINDNHNIHIRVHRQVHHEIYNFHSLHKTFKHGNETYIWHDDEPLEYFEA